MHVRRSHFASNANLVGILPSDMSFFLLPSIQAEFSFSRKVKCRMRGMPMLNRRSSHILVWGQGTPLNLWGANFYIFVKKELNLYHCWKYSTTEGFLNTFNLANCCTNKIHFCVFHYRVVSLDSPIWKKQTQFCGWAWCEDYQQKFSLRV